MRRNTYIKFDTAVRDHYRCNNHAIVFARLVYWATRNPEGFYKFKNKCDKHKLYKKGDSWAEELNMTRRDMDPVFKRLVQSYTSRRDYMKAEDKFNGKMFASYTNRKTNQTHYFMDKEAVDTFLGSLEVAKAPAKVFVTKTTCAHETRIVTETIDGLSWSREALISTPLSPLCATEVPSPALEPVDNLSGEHEVLPDPQRRAAQIVPPLAHAHQNTNTQTITSLVGTAPERSGNALGEEDKLSSQKMVEIWNSHAADKVAYYPSLAPRLCKVLKDCFAGCLERFRQFCSIAASSPFLMGKAPNSKFKAFFWWIIKPETIKTIFQGGYGVKEIAKAIASASGEVNLESEIKTVNSKIVNAEKAIKDSCDEVAQAQRKSIKEAIGALSPQEGEVIMQKIDAELEDEYPDGFGTKAMRSLYADGKLNSYFHAKLGFCQEKDIVAPQHLLDRLDELKAQKSELLKQRIAVDRKNRETAEVFMSACESAG